MGNILKIFNVCDIFRKGRSTKTEEVKEEKEIPETVTTIMAWAENSEFLDLLNLKIENFNLKPCCQEVAARELFNSDILREVICSEQKSDIWHKERQLRITGEIG